MKQIIQCLIHIFSYVNSNKKQTFNKQLEKIPASTSTFQLEDNNFLVIHAFYLLYRA